MRGVDIIELYVLFKALKLLVEDINYRTTFNDIDMLMPKSLGVYIKSGEVTDYRDVTSSEYINRCARVQMVVQSDKDLKSLISSFNVLSKIRDQFLKLNNESLLLDESYKFYMLENEVYMLDDEDDNISPQSLDVIIIKTDLLGDINSIGKNEQGMSIYDINFKMWYTITPHQ